MRVLGIETSGRYCGVAVVEGGKILAEITLESGNATSKMLFPEITRVFELADLSPDRIEGVAVSQGPGRFTGLRVGLAAAKGIARGLNAPLAGVPTLDAIAFGLMGLAGKAVVLTDAGKRGVYAATYVLDEGSGLERSGPYTVLAPQEILAFAPEDAVFAGEAAIAYRELLKGLKVAPETHAYPRASYVASIGREKLVAGEGGDPGALGAIYLRPSEAEEKFGRIMFDVAGQGSK